MATRRLGLKLVQLQQREHLHLWHRCQLLAVGSRGRWQVNKRHRCTIEWHQLQAASRRDPPPRINHPQHDETAFVATLHVRPGCGTSWLPARPPSSLSGIPAIPAPPPPCGAPARGQDRAPARRRLPPELDGGAHRSASHHQAGGAAHGGEDCRPSTHHQGLPPGSHLQGLPPVRSLPSAPSS